MYVSSLRVINFRNYKSASFDFKEDLNIIVGPNGAGKTSVLEAIYYLCISKSFRTSHDRDIVNSSEEYFQVFGEFCSSKKGKILVNFNYQRDIGKRAFVNGEKLERLSEIIGKIPVVILSPEYENVSSGGPSLRRRFLDRILSLTDEKYLKKLIDYRKILQERNELLRKYRDKESFSYDVLMETFDEKLVSCAEYIHMARTNFLVEFGEIVQRELKDISATAGDVSIRLLEGFYSSEYKRELRRELQRGFFRDVIFGRTATGPHLDKIEILFGGGDIRERGSQGEQKVVLAAIKLAEGEFIRNRFKEHPILLFDDMFAYLDDVHRKKLCEKLVCGAQVILTATGKGVLEYFPAGVDVKIIDVGVG